MDVVICPNADAVGREAAARIAAIIRRAGPRAVLGIATGSTPLPTYRELAALAARGELDLHALRAFALDEYVGLPAGHPESYTEVVRRTVTLPFGMSEDNVRVLDGSATDLDGAAVRFERLIAEAGGMDVELVGVGSNGHIGFNEPGSPSDSRTRLVELTERTRADNARYFATLDEVPTRALTQGLGTIGDSRAVIMVATGRQKAKAIAGVVEGMPSPDVPGSVLQQHRAATIIVDEDAASGLRRRYPQL